MQDHSSVERYSDALWSHTAVAEPDTSALEGDHHCDVAIVGAGFTGLNAALQLAKAGVSACVLEKNHIGFGASGRSGGQVNLGLNLGPSQLLSQFGNERGQRLIDLVLRTPASVFEFIREESLDCDPVTHAKSFVFHRFKDIGVSARVGWFSLLDYLSSRSQKS